MERERLEIEVVILKACPRCHGDVHKQRDKDGLYTACLQCGYVEHVAETRRKYNPVMGRQKPGRPQRDARKRSPA